MDLPWSDRNGRFSALRAAAVALVAVPALWLVFDAAAGNLGAKPLTEAIHETGHWAVRLLLVALALTPLRRITRWNRLVTVRRMIGLSAFAYAVAHLTLYVADQNWRVGHAASEIVIRFYLTIGFVALAGLAVLAATSTDAAIRRLGRRWQQLHRIVYALVALGVLHFFLQSKINATEAALMMGFWLLLMGWRVAHATGARLNAPLTLPAVAILAALATAALEALWYGVATGVPWDRVLEANVMMFTPWPRPAWIVLAVGLAVALVPLWKSFAGTSPRGRLSESRS